jgi:hypothetical protein
MRPLSVIVYGDALLAPEARPGLPEILTASFTSRMAAMSRPVVNAALLDANGFPAVARAIGADTRRGDGWTAVLVVTHADGKSDRVAPTDLGIFVAQSVEHLLARSFEEVVVVGPTGGGVLPGRRAAVGYGSYARWARRADKALAWTSSGYGPRVEYVTTLDLPQDHTRDGIRPLPVGWKWVAERVADAVVRVAGAS